MESTRRFFNQAIMAYKALFGMLTLQNYLLVKTLMPLLQLTFFVLVAQFAYNTTDLTPFVVGNALILAATQAFFGVSILFYSDRAMGTLKVIIASPINKFVIFIGRTFMYIVDGILSVSLGFLLGVLFFDLNLSLINIPLFILMILIGVFSIMGMGVLIGIFALITRELHLLLNIAFSLMLIFSGANIPINQLPRTLGYISFMMPLTRSIKAARILVSGNTQVAHLLIQELLVGCIYIFIALMIYNFLERKARKGSTLDVY